MKAINIDWDASLEERENLPSEIVIPKEIEDDIEMISDYLSDTTGFCVFGYELVVENQTNTL